jgi:hypothetical protein
MHLSRIVVGLAVASASSALPWAVSAFKNKQQGHDGKALPFEHQQLQHDGKAIPFEHQQLQHDGEMAQDMQGKTSAAFHQSNNQRANGFAMDGERLGNMDHFQQKQDGGSSHLVTSSSSSKNKNLQQRSKTDTDGASRGFFNDNQEKCGDEDCAGDKAVARGKQDKDGKTVHGRGEGMAGMQDCRADEDCAINMQEKCDDEDCAGDKAMTRGKQDRDGKVVHGRGEDMTGMQDCRNDDENCVSGV